MKSVYRLAKNFHAVVDNGRTHSIAIDLPPDNGGEDLGATALELCVMGLSGCIGTIFAKIAKKMRLTINHLDVDLEAFKGPSDPTVTKVTAKVFVNSPDSLEKLNKCLELTLASCPVGVIFTNAGIPTEVTLEKVA